MKGMSGQMIVMPSDRAMDAMATQSTAFGVAFFQKKPDTKMMTMAGLIQAEYS
jgi:hypothetical protein